MQPYCEMQLANTFVVSETVELRQLFIITVGGARAVVGGALVIVGGAITVMGGTFTTIHRYPL